jgi:hypothetical protein
MQKKYFGLFALLLLGFVLTGLQAQQNVITTGGNISGSSGSVSYSVGQVAYQTFTGITGSVAEGVQQAFEVSVVSGIDEANHIALSAFTYPNPASASLILEVDGFDLRELSYQLIDTQGKCFQTGKVTVNKTIISLDNYLPAVYFVTLTRGDKTIKVFKIVKS